MPTITSNTELAQAIESALKEGRIQDDEALQLQAIRLTAQTGDAHLLARLMSAGVSASMLTRPGSDGITPFHYAAHAGHHALILKMGRDLQAAGESVRPIMAASATGWTPVHTAAQRGHHLVIDAVVAVFRAAGQAAEVTDVLSRRLANQFSAADIARRRGHHLVIEALRRGGVQGLPAALQPAPVPAPAPAPPTVRRWRFKPPVVAPAVPLSHQPGTGLFPRRPRISAPNPPSAATGASSGVGRSKSLIRQPGH